MSMARRTTTALPPHPSLARRIETALYYARHNRRRDVGGRSTALVAVIAGCTVSQLTAWAAGDDTPPAAILGRLAGALGVTEHWLRTGDRDGEILAPFRRLGSRR